MNPLLRHCRSEFIRDIAGMAGPHGLFGHVSRVGVERWFLV